jgi:hypothetical protein
VMRGPAGRGGGGPAAGVVTGDTKPGVGGGVMSGGLAS